YPLAERVGKLDAGFQRNIAQRNKRYDVRRAHARMLPHMRVKIDQPRSRLNRPESGLHNRLRFPRKRYDRAVVVMIHLRIEQINAFSPNRRDDRLDNFRTPAFAEIGYTLDKRHQATPSILWLIVYKRRRRPWLARPALNVRLVGQSAKKVLIDHAPIISLMH